MSFTSAHQRLILRLSAALLAVALIAVAAFALIGSGDKTDSRRKIGPNDRVLQSVSVKMAPDGTMSGISDTVVATSADAKHTNTSTENYTPKKVVDELPVRVLTSYRTSKGTGTDLADLDGYTGRIRIDLTVQNLTAKSRNLTYDVGGSSRSQDALVGVPLTVVASTGLKDTPAAEVVSSTADGTAKTNGVLSQTKDGEARVQWATILAPPQMGASANLTLVLDAKDFNSPAFDLSVQPGLITDPSMGALVDAAFNPERSNEMELQSRTIKVIGEVNAVLARASATISAVRKTLESSSDTLGTRTVANLEASTSSIASSMQSLTGTLNALRQEVSGSMQSTESTALQSYDSALSAMLRLLGDTRASVPAASVTGEGCESVVAKPGTSDSVYGNLLVVAAQLDGYSKATTACKTSLQAAILASVGPSEPTAELCADSTSVTCSLFGAVASFDPVAEQLKTQSTKVTNTIDPKIFQELSREVSGLSSALSNAQQAVTNVEQNAPTTQLNEQIELMRANITQLGEKLTAFRDGLTTLRNAAIGYKYHAEGMKTQNDLAAQDLCRLATGPSALDWATVEHYRAWLVASPCPGSSQADPIGITGITPMSIKLQQDVDNWQDMIDKLDPNSQSADLGKALTEAAEVRQKLAANADAFQSIAEVGYGDLNNAIKQLTGTLDQLTAARNRLDTQLVKTQDDMDLMKANIVAAFDKAAQDTKDQIGSVVKPQIATISERSALDRESLGRMFNKSATALESSAQDIRANGAKTLTKQQAQAAEVAKAARAKISSSVAQGLSTISTGVSGSVTDLNGASTMLRGDLSNVLLDLGTRKVKGGGLLGAMATSAATAQSGDYQLALATDKASAYANVRGEDVAGILLRQAQSAAAQELLANLPPFVIKLPSGATHRTVYNFSIR